MPGISHSLNLFIKALNKNARIFCQEENWYIALSNQSTHSLLNCLNHRNEEKRLLDIIQIFSSILDKLEKDPIFLEKNKDVTFEKYIDAANAIVAYVNHYKSVPIADALIHLKRRSIALFYRNCSSEKITSCKPTDIAETQLFILAEKWKQSNSFAKTQHAFLSEKDKTRLRNSLHYTLFVELLSENKKLRDNFFKWIIRDNNEAESFIEFPATSDRLRNCFIDKRIGYYNSSELHIQTNETKSGFQKFLQLPFCINGKTSRINILDESTIIPFSSKATSIKAVFDEFANKKLQHGKYEFLQNGITEWTCDDFLGDIFQCNYISMHTEIPDFSLEDDPEQIDYIQIDREITHYTTTRREISYFTGEWWKKLPDFQILTKENIKMRYNIETLPDDKWITCLRASTISLEYQIKDNHGFIEIAIPDKKSENYHIYPFGLYPKHFPRHISEQATAMTGTLLAKIEYPDTNVFRSDLYQVFFPKLISAEAGFNLMHSIQKDIASIFNNNLSIQITSQNCAFWAGEKFILDESFTTNPFELTFGNMKPTHFALKTMTNLPSFIERPILSTLRFFSTHNSLEIKENNKTFNKQIIFGNSIKNHVLYPPIKLARDIIEEKKEGTVRFGF